MEYEAVHFAVELEEFSPSGQTVLWNRLKIMALPITISDINGTTHLNGVIIRSTQMIQTATMIMAIFPFPILPQLLTTQKLL
jgi:hypothetical protein